MSGNLWEWCQYKWHDYKSTRIDGNAWENNDRLEHISIGCSWYDASNSCRISQRAINHADNNYYLLGFRLALTL